MYTPNNVFWACRLRSVLCSKDNAKHNNDIRTNVTFSVIMSLQQGFSCFFFFFFHFLDLAWLVIFTYGPWTHSSYPDRDEFIEEGSLLFLGIRRSDVIFSHMSPSWPSWVTGIRAQVGLCCWTWFREANGRPVPLQTLNLLTENGLSIHWLRCPVGLRTVKDST